MTGRDRPRQDRARQAARPRGGADSDRGADAGRGATVTQLRAAPAPSGQSRPAQPRAAQPRAAQPRAAQLQPARRGQAQSRPAQSRPGPARQDSGPASLRGQRPATTRVNPVAAAAEAVRIGTRAPAGRAAGSRTPFVLLLLAMLGGGLICLLVINTTLGSTSFEIDRLQQSVSARQLQVQQLQQQVSADQNSGTIEREACRLGMRPQQKLEFLDLRTHRVTGSPPTVATPAWCGR
jgi:hypothetical protein